MWDETKGKTIEIGIDHAKGKINGLCDSCG